MKLRPPSPALVLSIIAIVVACAGTAYAATRITSSSQIRNGVIAGADIRSRAITGPKIKNGTITPNKFSPGALRRIDRPRTTVGGGAALEAFRKSGPENQAPNVVVKVMSMSIPAGAYVITAKTVMTPFTGTTNILEALVSAPGSVGGHCKLDAGGDVDESQINIAVQNRPTPSTLHMQLTRTVAGATNVDLLCDAGITWRTSDTTIIATPVASANRSDASASGA